MKFLWVQTPIQVPPLSARSAHARESDARIVSRGKRRLTTWSLVKKKRHAWALPLLVQLFFLLCSVWMVCCCREGVLFRGHIPPVGAASSNYRLSAASVLLHVQYRHRPQGAPPHRETLALFRTTHGISLDYNCIKVWELLMVQGVIQTTFLWLLYQHKYLISVLVHLGTVLMIWIFKDTR